MEKKKKYRRRMGLLYTLQVCVLGLSQFDLGAVENNIPEFSQKQVLIEKSKETVTSSDEILVYNGSCCEADGRSNVDYYSYDQGCCYYETPCQEACQQQSCSPCVEDECCQRIEYVNYTPFEEGMNPGLYSLPGSTCAYSCPTKPSGAELYSKQGRLSHRLRYPSERSPAEWRTIMLHMRTLLPMTACSYRKILYFLQERPYKPEVDPVAAAMANKPSSPTQPAEMAKSDPKSTASKSIAKNAIKKDKLIADAFGDENDASYDEALVQDEELDGEEALSLEDLVGPIDTSGINLMASGPIGGSGIMPKFNFTFSGWGFLEYQSPSSSYFGDFNGDRGFFYALAPIFMSSYGDHLLTFIKLAAYNYAQSSLVVCPEAWVAYFFNDFLTLKLGKFTTPFGSYWAYHFGWVDKFGSFPLIRPFFSPPVLVTSSDIGVQLQGAIPLCSLGSWFNQSSFTYQAWAGNGPSEAGEGNDLGIPPGAIYLAEANQPNNNNDITFGGRLGFLPNDCTIFGLSYMRGRWNSNAKSFGLDPSHHLYYEAAAFDWMINVNRYIKIYGEYIWTQYENNLNPDIFYQGPVAYAEPQQFDSPLSGHPWVRQNGYWAAMSFELGLMRCVFPSLYWCNPGLWDSLELALRSEGRWNQTSGVTSLWPAFGGFDYSGFDQRRFTVCLGYYFTESFSMKINYDINYGDTGDNWLYQFVTGTTEKTGYGKNVFTLRFVYGW